MPNNQPLASARPASPRRPVMRAAAAGLGLLLLATPVLAAAPGDHRGSAGTIAVSGQGSASARPDMAELSAAVVSTARTAAEAVTANSAAMEKAIAALKAAGVDDKDVATSGFSVMPRFSSPAPNAPAQNEEPRIIGYEVRNALTVRVHDLGALGTVLDRLVAAGANEVGGLSLTISDPAKVADSARREAVADARRKAEIYASAAGVRLGRVLRVSERGAGGPEPVAMMMRADMAKASVPVAAGEQRIGASVDVVWEIER